MIFIAVLFLLMIGYVLGNYGAQACATSHDELTEQKTILTAIKDFKYSTQSKFILILK